MRGRGKGREGEEEGEGEGKTTPFIIECFQFCSNTHNVGTTTMISIRRNAGYWKNNITT